MYWLWSSCLLAYDAAPLSEQKRFIYKNNIAVNIVGKQRNYIANVHLVEITVHRIQETFRAAGANVTFQSIRRAATFMNTVSCVKKMTNLQNEKWKADNTRRQTDRFLSVFLRAPVLAALFVGPAKCSFFFTFGLPAVIAKNTRLCESKLVIRWIYSVNSL